MNFHERRSQGRYRFGRFELRVGTRELLDGGVGVPLGGRAFDLLVCLVEGRGRTVTKDDLLEAVWPGRVVIDNNLNAQVATLRKALGAGAVLTVPGQGFQFGWEVHDELPLLHGDCEAREMPAVAVLPFQNLSGDPDEDYFALGMAEDVLNALSRFRQFRVIARGSSFAPGRGDADIRQIGAELGARYVLRGSVRRAAGRLRVLAQLLETDRGRQLWSDGWDGSADQMFDLQDEIAARVALLVQPMILQAEVEQVRRKRPEALAAHDLVLRALPHLYAMRPLDNAAALPLLLRALELDPGYAWAQAHTAWCYEQRLSRGWPSADESQRAAAVALARHALAAAADDAVVVGIAGFVLFAVGRDDFAGLAALRRACALNPNAALVANLAGTAQLFGGDLDSAVEQLERVRQLSPVDPAAFMFLSALACARLLRGEAQAALGLCAESVAANPDWDFTWWVAAAAAGEAGDATQAAQALRHLRRIGPAPGLTFPKFLIFRDEQRRHRLLASLRKAGLAGF